MKKIFVLFVTIVGVFLTGCTDKPALKADGIRPVDTSTEPSGSYRPPPDPQKPIPPAPPCADCALTGIGTVTYTYLEFILHGGGSISGTPGCEFKCVLSAAAINANGQEIGPWLYVGNTVVTIDASGTVSYTVAGSPPFVDGQYGWHVQISVIRTCNNNFLGASPEETVVKPN
jgi:hypothetical protein